MNENEILVAESVAENTEQTAEQIAEQTPAEKTFTQAEVNDIVGKAKALAKSRTEAKLRKEYDKKYGELESTLMAGTGKQSVEEINDALKAFYAERGVSLPNKSHYSDSDTEVLARADADEIIGAGFDEVVEEVDRLNKIGLANMTARERATFKALAEYRQKTLNRRELAGIGVTEDVYESQEFKDFASKFNANTPVKDIYDIYAKTQPKKEFKTMGSMKHTASANSAVKEYYSPEEAKKFTRKELDNNPALYEAIVKSMQKWK